jgi:hypothetical protein
MIRKWLAVGIILLFIGVAVAPSINQNVVKASQEDDLIEVTTQACGIQGYGDNTVKLTRQQYQDLEEYLVEFRARLNQTTTREEAIPIFKEAVVELDKYGLLPRGMSVEQAQRFVLRCSQNEILLNYQQRFEIFPQCINLFCLLSMTATNDWNSYIRFIFPGGPLLLFSYILLSLLVKIGAENLANGLLTILLYFCFFNPLKLMNIIFIMEFLEDFHSIGLKGVVDSDDVFMLLGYTGLYLVFLDDDKVIDKVYLLGSALAIV